MTNKQVTIQSAVAEQQLCKHLPLLVNHCNNHACNFGRLEELCFLHGSSETTVNGVLRQSVPRSYKWEDLLGRSSVCKETTFLNGVERFSRE
jgi:hypothetical protein